MTVVFLGEAAVSQATATGDNSATSDNVVTTVMTTVMEQDQAALAAAAKRRETIDGHIADLQKRVDGIKAERKNKGRGRPNVAQANRMATLQSNIVRLQRGLLPEDPSPPKMRPQTTDELRASAAQHLQHHAAAATACSIHVPPPCQPPLREPPKRPAAELPPELTRSSILLAAFEVDDLRQELLRVSSLASKRAMACVCTSLCSHVTSHLHAPSLSVSIEDATFNNAAFVGRLPNLERLHVQGETSLPRGLDLKYLRSLDRITINRLGFEAALFLGAAISGGYQTLRLSNNSCVLLAPLRTRERINLSSRELRDSDLAALLGALSLNAHIKELNIAGNPAPVGNSLRAAMVQALPWLLRHEPLCF